MSLTGGKELIEHYVKEAAREAVTSGKATIAQKAMYTIMQNQECFVAQWILQNPDADMSKCVMYHQPDSNSDGQFKFWIEFKE